MCVRSGVTAGGAGAGSDGSPDKRRLARLIGACGILHPQRTSPKRLRWVYGFEPRKS